MSSVSAKDQQQTWFSRQISHRFSKKTITRLTSVPPNRQRPVPLLPPPTLVDLIQVLELPHILLHRRQHPLPRYAPLLLPCPTSLQHRQQDRAVQSCPAELGRRKGGLDVGLVGKPERVEFVRDAVCLGEIEVGCALVLEAGGEGGAEGERAVGGEEG